MILKNVERKVSSLKRRQTTKESIRHPGNQELHAIYSGGRWRTYDMMSCAFLTPGFSQ